MILVRVVNESRQQELGCRVRVAQSLFERLRGWLRRPPPSSGEGLMLSPCQGVQTFWLRYGIDVLMLDQDGQVIALHPELPPGSCTPLYPSASFALELPAGAIASSGTAVGDRLSWTIVTA